MIIQGGLQQPPLGKYVWEKPSGEQGLNVAPEIFQRRMETLFEGVQGVQVVMGDILVFGSNEAEHDAIVIQVLDILEKAKVTLNKDKCKIKLQEVKYLGHILTSAY